MGFFRKCELDVMKRRELKRRIPLRHDTAPAAPVVILRFADIQIIRGIQQAIAAGDFETDLSADVRARFERDAWNHLIACLLEAPREGGAASTFE